MLKKWGSPLSRKTRLNTTCTHYRESHQDTKWLLINYFSWLCDFAFKFFFVDSLILSFFPDIYHPDFIYFLLIISLSSEEAEGMNIEHWFSFLLNQRKSHTLWKSVFYCLLPVFLKYLPFMPRILFNLFKENHSGQRVPGRNIMKTVAGGINGRIWITSILNWR